MASRLRVLLISFYFPPAGGGGVRRPLKLAQQLPSFGIEMHVLAPGDPKWIHRDEDAVLPEDAVVWRAGYHGPRGRRPAEEIYGLRGIDRLQRHLALLPRRLVVPDENAPWVLTAAPRAIQIVREAEIDLVVTTSPPNSIHAIGALVSRVTGVPWVADLRDSIVAKPDRRIERRTVRVKERTQVTVARLVAKRAAAVTAVTHKIADETKALNSRLHVEVIPNGADFDDYDGIPFRGSTSFRITHTGSFFAARDPRPFLTALGRADPDVVARFVGDFRSSDYDWAVKNGVADRLQLIPFVSHRQALELQRDSEALLLLLPDVGERGRDVPSGKIFEYLASRRPILAVVPPEGSAAELIREANAGVVAAPDDVDAIADAIASLVARWRSNTLEPPPLPDQLRDRLDRRERSREFAALLHEVAAAAKG